MKAIPPNNLEQLVAWIRLFAEDVSNKIRELQNALSNLQESLRNEKTIDDQEDT